MESARVVDTAPLSGFVAENGVFSTITGDLRMTKRGWSLIIKEETLWY
jgi:hypothetical protein